MQHALCISILLGSAVVAEAAPDFAAPSCDFDETGVRDSDERPGFDYPDSQHPRRRSRLPITGHDTEFGGSDLVTSFRLGGLGDSSHGLSGTSGGGGSDIGQRAPHFIPLASIGTSHGTGSGAGTGTSSSLSFHSNHNSNPTSEALNYVNSNPGLPGIAGPTIASSGGIGGAPLDDEPTTAAPVPASALLAGAGIACIFALRGLRTARLSLTLR